MKTPEELAQEHWDWTKGLLDTTTLDWYPIDTLEYVFKTAFQHGYKHAKGDKE